MNTINLIDDFSTAPFGGRQKQAPSPIIFQRHGEP